MKFGLYYSDKSHNLIRCVDGHFDCIALPSPRYGFSFQAIIEAPGRPCSQDKLRLELRRNGSLLTPTRAIAHVNYDVPDDVDLYTFGDFGVHK